MLNAAQPGEFAAVELRFPKQWLKRHTAANGGNNAAVPGRDTIDVHRCLYAASAWHVLRDEGRIARNVFAHEAAEQSRIKIIAAARAVADHKRNAAAAIELLD